MRAGRSDNQECRGPRKQKERKSFSSTWLNGSLFRRDQRDAQQKLGFDGWKKIIPKPAWIAPSTGTVARARLSRRPALQRSKFAGVAGLENRSILFLRADLVAVIPINRRIGCRIVGHFGGRRFILLALRALLFLHLALFDALHFLLALLECRGHKPLLTAECGEGPGPCRPADPWKRKTTSVARAAAALTHGNLRFRIGPVRRPFRVHLRLLPVRHNSSD